MKMPEKAAAKYKRSMAILKTLERAFPSASEWTAINDGRFFVAGWVVLPSKAKKLKGTMTAQYVVLASGWEGK